MFFALPKNVLNLVCKNSLWQSAREKDKSTHKNVPLNTQEGHFIRTHGKIELDKSSKRQPNSNYAKAAPPINGAAAFFFSTNIYNIFLCPKCIGIHPAAPVQTQWAFFSGNTGLLPFPRGPPPWFDF